ISYTVADNDGNRSAPATVSVDYSAQPPTAVNDSITGIATNTPATVQVLGNDTDPDGSLDASSVTLVGTSSAGDPLVVAGEGTWSVDASGAITFTPETGFTADPTPVSYTVADNDGNVSNTATVSVDYAVRPPVAANDTLSGQPANQPVLVNVLANDSDPDGTLDPATLQINGTSSPGAPLTVTGQGTWSIGPSAGTITFTPEAGFTGDPDPIGYQVADNDGNLSNIGTVVIDVVATPPQALNDAGVGTIGNPVIIDVLANDSDADGTLVPTSVQLAGTAAPGDSLTVAGEGTWSINSTTGAITFTPDTGFTGDPTPVTYTVADNDGNVSAPASVRADYGPVAPLADHDSVSGVQPGDPVTINVLANDTDPDGSLDPSSVQIAGTTSPGSPLTVPGEGVWTIDPATGAIRFTPEAGFTADPTPISYTVADNDGQRSGPASVLVDYDPLPPSAAADLVTGATPGQPVGVNVLGNDSDPDGSLVPASVRIVGTNAPGDPLTVPGEGVWSIDPSTGVITFAPQTGFTGDPTPISYTVADNDGNVSAPATVTIDYDVAPPLAEDDVITGATTANPVVVNVVNNDTDPDGSIDPRTVTITGTSGPGVALTVPGEGQWSVDSSTGAITFTPEAGFTADPAPITYTVADNDGNVSAPATVSIDFDPRPPVAGNDEVSGVTPGSTVVVNVLGNDADPDGSLNAASLQIAGTAAPGDPLVVAGEGTWIIDPSAGTITFTPEPGFLGQPTPISYTVADNDGNRSGPATVAINTPPVATSDSVTGAPTGTPVVIDVLANDDTGDTVVPSSVQIAGTSAPGQPLIVIGQGTWSINPVSGAIIFEPEPGFTGDPAPISYTVADSDGNRSQPASVTVAFAPNPPTPEPDLGVGVPGQPVIIDVLANDSDSDGTLDPSSVQILGTAAPGDPLVVPGEGIWTIDTISGAITFTPDASFNAVPTPIAYRVADNDGNVSTPASVAVTFASPANHEIVLPASEGRPDIDPPAPVEGEPPLLPGATGIVVNTVNAVDQLVAGLTALESEGIIVNTVNRIDSLGETAPLEGAKGIVNRVIREQWELEEMAQRAAAAFDSASEAWGARPLVGFSLRTFGTGFAGGNFGAGDGQIIVDTLIRNRMLYVEITNSLNHAIHGPVIAYRVTHANGGALPEWANHADFGMIMAHVPYDAQPLYLRISAKLQDGTVINHYVEIRTDSGQINPLDPRSLQGRTFDDQARGERDRDGDRTRSLARDLEPVGGAGDKRKR
ncbi:MAG: Ig-like domain-containing protein, partial [Pseudomonadota bacterium]